jgi:hypothetical protein
MRYAKAILALAFLATGTYMLDGTAWFPGHTAELQVICGMMVVFSGMIAGTGYGYGHPNAAINAATYVVSLLVIVGGISITAGLGLPQYALAMRLAAGTLLLFTSLALSASLLRPRTWRAALAS